MQKILSVSIVLLLFCATPLHAGPRLNEIQVIGTHNSYHIAPEKSVRDRIDRLREGAGKGLDYTHRPLPEQFTHLGVRQIELDLYADPEGGRFAPSSSQAANHDAEYVSLMKKPGLKILHGPGYDQRTTVPTFVKALQQIRDWSKANPKHVPLFVLIEVKSRGLPGLSRVLPFDRTQLEVIDKEILSVLGRDHILAPDDVRGGSPTLREAVTGKGWPELDAARGRIMFALDNTGREKDTYLEIYPELKSAMLFVSVREDHPAAAWMKINDPVGSFKRIQNLVKKGFMIRTRADGGTRQARSNDPSQREKAFASGAQFISTDYPEPDKRFSEYSVKFPSGVIARTNPVNGDPKLKGKELE